MDKRTLLEIAEGLRAGRAVRLSVEDFPCFSAEATEGNPHVGPETLEEISAALTAEDAVVFERAARAMDEGDLAWIGFKVVWDADAAVSNVDNEVTKKYGEDQAWKWQSTGVDGYTIEPCEKDTVGTDIIMHIKPDTEEEKDEYSQYLREYPLYKLVKKYSDYIRFPIRMLMPHPELKEGSTQENPEYEEKFEWETLNSMVPLWQRKKADVKKEEYDEFYQQRFADSQSPLSVITVSAEGAVTYKALLFIPEKAPLRYYSEEFEGGLQLYSAGVMIMDKCKELLPECFNFVRGVVESPDLNLNISRELLQHDRQLKLIGANLEKKVKAELERLLRDEREKYESFWQSFGRQIKLSAMDNYGEKKDMLQDLMLFYSSTEKKLTTLKEYVGRMKEGQEAIYYGCGRTVEAIDALPQADQIKEAGYEMLYMTGQVDEFAIKTLREYDGKKFLNIRTDEIDLSTEEQKKALAEENEAAADLFAAMKEALGEKVHAVRFTDKLKSHPVCLSTEGGLSMEMEQTLNAMPGRENRFKADVVLELNPDHPVTAKLKEYAVTDKEKLADYAKLLYAEGCLIGGVPIEEPAELCRLITGLMEQ